MKISSEKVINIVYDALSINTYIQVVGGSLTLNYYATTGVFIPDRVITPLKLNPILEIKDPNGVLSTSNAQSKLLDITWFEGTNRIVTHPNYTINTDNSLTVKGNSLINTRVRFEAYYLDTRKNQRIFVTSEVNLLTIPLMEVESNPVLTLSKPSNWIVNPLKENMTELEIGGTLFLNGKKLKGMLNWTYQKSDKSYESIEEAPFYIEGNYTDKITINPKSIENVIIKADDNIPEDFKNKLLGINPEWDDKMQEVFGNEIGGRNLYTQSEATYSQLYREKSVDDSFYAMYSFPVAYEANKYKDYSNILDNRVYFPNKLFKSGQQYILHIEYKSLPNSKSKGGENIGSLLFNYTDGSVGSVYTIPVDKEKPLYGYIEMVSDPNKDVDFIGGAYWLIGNFYGNIKLEKGNKPTPYTPAPEDLNYRNLITNGDFNKGLSGWSGYLSNRKIVSNGIEVSNEKSNRVAQVWKEEKIFKSDDIMYSCVRISDCTKVDKIQLKWGVSGSSIENLIDSKDNPPVNFILSGLYKVTGDTVRKLMVQYYPEDLTKIVINNCIIINLTQTFGKGNEPTKEQLDAVFANMPYIQAPEDYAPDGIIKGEYEATTNLIRQFPKSLDVEIIGQNRVKEGVKTVKLRALVSTKNGIIAEPLKFFKIIWYAQENNAGALKTKVGEGLELLVEVRDKRKMFVELEDLK